MAKTIMSDKVYSKLPDSLLECFPWISIRTHPHIPAGDAGVAQYIYCNGWCDFHCPQENEYTKEKRLGSLFI